MSLTGFPLDTAELTGTMLESIVYGGAVIATYRTISDLNAREDRGGTVNRVFKTAPWLLMLVATMRLAIDWYRNLYAFTVLPGREERVLFLIDITNWTYALKDALYGVQSWVGDLVVIYRAYIVWERQWPFIVLPCISWLITLATSLASIILEAEANLLFVGRLKTFVSIAFISMVVTTVTSTTLIILRIYKQQKRNAAHMGWKSGPLNGLAAIILQSGFIYSATIIVVFSFFQAGSNVQIIPYNTICSLVPLLFSNMMSGTTSQSRSQIGTSQSVEFRSANYRGPPAIISGRNVFQRDARSKADGDMPLEIGVTELVEIHHDPRHVGDYSPPPSPFLPVSKEGAVRGSRNNVALSDHPYAL